MARCTCVRASSPELLRPAQGRVLAGKAGVALSTLGPGATNMTTSAAYAQLGGFPALLITGTGFRSWDLLLIISPES